MTLFRMAIVSAALAYAMPAAADEFFAVTPSGAAETLFPEEPKAVVGKLSSKCIDAKWTVISSSDTELVCEAPLNSGQSFLGQMLMGNRYSTPPRRFFRFNIASVQGISRVQASGWMELQMAFGQMKRTDFSGPEFHNSIIAFMGAAGGKLPKGTTFPNHVMVGVQGASTPLGKYVGLYITKVDPGSPADAAGLVPGDIISRVGDKLMKNTGEDWLDATAAVLKNPTYPVEVIHNGKKKLVTLTRALRPPISDDIVPLAPAIPANPGLATATPSIADEMVKLAKLKAEGVITDAEFQAAKAKLLSR